MGNYFKLSMFITSFIPLWITILFVDALSLINRSPNIKTEIIGIAIIFLANIFSFFIIKKSMKSINTSEYANYKIAEVSPEKGITSEYLLSYILPLFAFDFTYWGGVIQFLIYFCTLAFLCIRNNNVYANLILEFQKYKFYSCQLIWSAEPTITPINTIVISRKELSAEKGNTIRVALLNKPFYLNQS